MLSIFQPVLRSLTFALALSCALIPLPTLAQDAPQPLPSNSLGVHTLLLTEAGELYLFFEQPVGLADSTPGADIAAMVDLAKLFPSVAAFKAYNALSEVEKEVALTGAMHYVDWSSVSVSPDETIAQATILLDLAVPDISILQSQMFDHVGAMTSAWKWVLEHPFSSTKEGALSEALAGNAPMGTQETWGSVGAWIEEQATEAWEAGGSIAVKLLPGGQAIEMCVMASEIVEFFVEGGPWAYAEELIEFCGECAVDAWEYGSELAYEAWCWIGF